MERDPRRTRTRSVAALGVRLDEPSRPRAAGLHCWLRVRPGAAGIGPLRRRPPPAGTSGLGAAGLVGGSRRRSSGRPRHPGDDPRRSNELVLPTVEALAGEDVLVVVTTGGIDPTTLGELPANVRTAPFVPTSSCLPRHRRSSPTVATWAPISPSTMASPSCKSATPRRRPRPERGSGTSASAPRSRRHRRRSRLRKAVRYVLDDAAVRNRVARLAVEYRRHDAPAESAQLLVELAARRSALELTPT